MGVLYSSNKGTNWNQPYCDMLSCFLIDGVICTNVDVYVDVIFGE
jgi:hypothetical protein